jgi:hypothetical protein
MEEKIKGKKKSENYQKSGRGGGGIKKKRDKAKVCLFAEENSARTETPSIPFLVLHVIDAPI